jgi:hexosaminidase
VHTYLYNIDDATFDFLKNVLVEVMDLFPGRYIHVGGDEAAKDQWHASARVQDRMKQLHLTDEAALQSWFIARIETFIDAHGRKLIGWDEILEGGLAPRATVMSWQGVKGGIEAAKQDHDVVMSPSPALYLDHVQTARHDEPPGRPDVVSVESIYDYEPVPAELDDKQARHILGAQANLWTEYMDTPQRIEHAAFPRAAALAETLWSPRDTRRFADFAARLPAQFERYRALDIAFDNNALATGSSATASDSRLLLNSDELQPCKPGAGLPLRLPGPAVDGGEIAYRVDIFDPCWIYPSVDTDSIRGIDVVAAERPYNFQLWHDADKVVLRKPARSGGALEIHSDTCDGALLASVSLHGAADERGIAHLHAALARGGGVHPLCFTFTRDAPSPLWMIDTVQLRK